MKMKSSKIIFVVLLLAAVAMMLAASPAKATPSSCPNANAIINPGNQTVPEASIVDGVSTPTVVILDGTNSNPKDNNTHITTNTCQWTSMSSPPIAIANSNSCTATFTAPEVGPSGASFDFRLTVTETQAGCTSITDTKTTTINITNVETNRPPVASATATPSVVNEGATVTLDGTASSDPDPGTTLTYAWTQTAGTSVTINNVSEATATFTAPAELYPNGETLTFQLTVSDGSLSGLTTVNVTVNSVNQPPTAVISPLCPLSVDEGASVTLDGSGSSDPDQSALLYQWSQVYGIPNADLTRVDLTASSITFTAPPLTSLLHTMTFGLTVTDNGGLLSSAECDIVVNDITPPSIECTGADQTIWYGDNVTVNCTASDVASGLADETLAGFALTTNVSAGTETDSASTNSKEVCDNANNCDYAGPYAFKVDKKAPTVICGTADAAWHATDQSVTCTVTDGGSGPASPTVTLSTNVPVGTETADASSDSKNAYDNVSNSAIAGPVTGFKIDKKAPSITASATKADATGYTGTWTNQSVTVHFVCNDGGSGVKSCGPDVTLSSDGVTTSVAGTAIDNVGNTAGATFGPVKIDKTPPTASASASPASNANGWNNTDVTVTFSGTDNLSGIASCTADVTLSSEGIGQSASGTCTDNAGNVSVPTTRSGINIDKTSPGIAWNGGPVDGGIYYWGFVPATPTCTATDALSGPDGCTVTGYSNSIGSQKLTATATDLAGNTTVETRSYTVNAWTLKGFYQPVDMPIPTMVYNTVKNGSTVPLKFEIFAGPTELTDIGAVKSLTYIQTSCQTGATTDDIEETLASTGGTVLRYDTTGGQFIYNWKTSGITGKCYRVTVTTGDDSSLIAYFKLK